MLALAATKHCARLPMGTSSASTLPAPTPGTPTVLSRLLLALAAIASPSPTLRPSPLLRPALPPPPPTLSTLQPSTALSPPWPARTDTPPLASVPPPSQPPLSPPRRV